MITLARRGAVAVSLTLSTLLLGGAVVPAASAAGGTIAAIGPRPVPDGGGNFVFPHITHTEWKELGELHDLQVQNRVLDGQPEQTYSGKLAIVANRWARTMADDSSDGMGVAALRDSTTEDERRFTAQLPPGYVAVATNVGYTDGFPADLNTAWRNSPEHRAALADPQHDYFALGNSYDIDGRLWVAAIYADYDGNPDDPSTYTPYPAPPPKPVDPPVVTPPVVPPPVAPPVTTPSGVTVAPVFGPDRYATSVAVARQAAPQAREVVIVNGADGSADSLAGGPLAASVGAGLVLTGRDALPDDVTSYLRAQGISKAYVLGGTSAVSPGVVDQLTALGVSVERISGRDRYETSVKVSATPSLRGSSTVVVAGGTALADAVSAGGIAGALHAPVVLVPRDGALPGDGLYDTTRARTTVVVTGSTGVVSDAVAGQLGADLRLGGRDRYETSLAIARWGIASGVPADAVAVTTAEGTNTADALSAAALGHITLLTPRAGWSDGVKQFLTDHRTQQVLTVGGRTPKG